MPRPLLRVGSAFPDPPVADRLLAEGRVGEVRRYDYDAIVGALDDHELAVAIDGAKRALVADGTLARLGTRWLADSDPRARSMMT